MKFLALVFLAALMSGCQVIHELKAPPFPDALIQHTRVFGLEAKVPNQAGDSFLVIRLGLVAESAELIPCSTNRLYMPPISDDFILGQTVSLLPSTSVTESLTTGWTAQPPAPRMKFTIR